jgi:uncharacterized protein (DUF58 family)
VNQRERESSSEITIFLDARAAGAVGTVQDNTFLYSCRAAASLTDLFLGNRSRVALKIYGEGVERVDRRVSQNLGQDVLEAVTRAKPQGSLSLEKVVDEALPTIKPKTPVYLLSSLLDDPGIERAIASLRAYDCRVIILSPNAAAFARQAGDGASALDVEVIAAERERTLAALRGMGALALDWQPGASLNLSLLTGVV